MKRFFLPALVLPLCLAGSTGVHAIAPEEHERLTQWNFDDVMEACGFVTDTGYRFVFDDDRAIDVPHQLLGEENMGDLCRRFAAKDEALSRFHISGWTVFNQLRLLSAEELGAAWTVHETGDIRTAELPDHNVIVNYLLHHVLALRLAERAGEAESEADLRRALAYEAIALGYLGDVFSSGHMLVPLTDRFQFMHSTNNRKTHDAFSNDGVFMIDSKGDVWLGFGDKLISWYEPTVRHLNEAIRTSCRELVLVFLAAGGGDLPDGISDWTYENVGFDWQVVVREWTVLRDGVDYYNDGILPVLMLLPMPIAATWSVPSGAVGQALTRFQYPQLADSGYHDPSLDRTELDVLYKRADMPRWLVFPKLRRSSPAKLIRDDPAVASVRYVQARQYDPAFEGFMVSAAFGWATHQEGSGRIWGAGVGYGFLDGFAMIKKVSANFDVYAGYDEVDRMLLSPSLQLALRLPGQGALDLIRTGRFEFGWAWGVKAPFNSNGFRFGWGLEPATIPLGFTNAGVTVRVKYQWILLETEKAGLQLELVLH